MLALLVKVYAVRALKCDPIWKNIHFGTLFFVAKMSRWVVIYFCLDFISSQYNEAFQRYG